MHAAEPDGHRYVRSLRREAGTSAGRDTGGFSRFAESSGATVGAHDAQGLRSPYAHGAPREGLFSSIGFEGYGGAELCATGQLASDKGNGQKRGNMNLVAALHFANLFFAGILAGIEIAIHYGFRRPAKVLSDQPHLQLRQALVLRLRILVPAFFVPTAVSGIAVAVLDRAAPGLWSRCAALLALLIWVVIRVIGTVPINSATLTWEAAAPPKNWKALVDHAERFHIIGVWAAVTAFAFFLVAPGGGA